MFRHLPATRHARAPRLAAPLLVALLAGGAGLTARAEQTFRLRDYVHHTWRDELVTYRVALPRAVAERPELTDAAGHPVSVQVQRSHGKYDVSFVVRQLPADGTATYTLRAGTPIRGSLVRAEGEAVVLDGGEVATRVPAPGAERFANAVPLHEAPPPLLAIRVRSRAWMGAGRMLGGAPVTAVRSEIVAAGPVFAESRTEYALQGGRYEMRVRVVRGQDAVFVYESFDTPKAAVGKAYFGFDLSPGLEPDRTAAEIRTWRKRSDETETPLGPDYRLDFDEGRREMSILGYVNWWPETAMRATFYRSGDAANDAVSVIPARIGRWRNPMGMCIMTTPQREVALHLPIFIDQDWVRDGMGGGRYYTGRLEPGWPRTAGRREWVLHCTTVGEALPKEGRSSVLEATRKYSSLPLDKVKDWVLEWKHDPSVTYPRLFFTRAQLPAIRERVERNARWMERLNGNPALAYAITQDPQVGHDRVFKGDPADKGEWAWQSMGSLQSLREYVGRFMAAGYLGERWGTTAPNQSRPMLEMTKFDAAMGVAGLDEKTRAELRHLMAFVAHVVYDQDWNPTLAGFHRGNVNMPPRQEHHLGVASCVLPDHPLARAWRRRELDEEQWQMEHMVSPGGAWRECPSYQMDAAHLPLFQAAVAIRNSGGPDLFSDARLKSTWDYLLNLSTPPDARFGVRVLPAFGNGTWLPAPIFGWLANLTRNSDPAFSRRMQWMWYEQGMPDWYPFSEALIDPGLPARRPHLVSKRFPGFGVVLRSGFPSADETWLAYRIGESVEHYNYGDQGSFRFYAKGAPLILQFGSIYFPQYRGAWYFNRVSIGHQDVRPGLFGGTEFWDIDLDPNYTGRVIGFGRLGVADYVVGQHVQERQGLIPDDARVPIPNNAPTPEHAIPRHVWTRQMLLMKSLDAKGDEDASGPTYLVMKDSIESAHPLPTEWNLWLWADGIDFDKNLAHCRSPYGVDLNVFMAEPAEPKWMTRQDATTFGPGGGIGEHWSAQHGGAPWRETLTNLRASQAPGGGFYAVLYPRKDDETAPRFTTVAGGKGVEVEHPRGKDVVFLGLRPVNWAEGNRTFSGAAGAIRQEGERLSLVLLGPGEVSAGGYTLKADAPASVTIERGKVSVVTQEAGQAVSVTRPDGTSERVKGSAMRDE